MSKEQSDNFKDQKTKIIGNVKIDENGVAHEVTSPADMATLDLLSRIEQLEAELAALKGNKK